MYLRIRPFVHAAAFFALAAVSIAQTAVPVVDQVADRESTNSFARHDEPIHLHVGATNSPTHFDATGLPPRVSFTSESFNNVMAGVFTWVNGELTGGAYTVSVTATNAVGTSAPMTFHWIIHPGMIDFVKTDKRTYVPGDIITFQTTFSAPVIVTGTPYMPLWDAKKAMYVSGSGTDTLIFKYQVTADDPQVSQFYAAGIVAADGSITTSDGVSASLHDNYAGLGDYPYFSITGPTPTPDAVTGISFFRLLGTSRVVVTLSFSHSVTVTGSPLLHLTVNGVARTASVTDHGTDWIQFTYVPQPGDNGVVALQSPLDLNGGTITGANGLAVDRSFNVPDTSRIIVDTTPPATPVVTSFTSSGAPTFTGTAEPNSYITLIAATRRTLGWTVGADGNFNIHWGDPPLPPGTYTFTLTATDDASNRSGPSAPVTITATYPAKTTTPVITSVDSSGTLSGTAAPGVTVNIFSDGYFDSAGSTQSGSDGRWSLRPLSVSSPSASSSTFTFTAVAYVGANNVSDRSAPFTFTLGTPSSQGVPVVSNATVTGQVGTAIAPMQLQATNSPTSFTADASLGNYGLQLSGSGVLSGTPTQAANGVAISFTASNGSGQSAPGTLTLNLAAAQPAPSRPVVSNATVTGQVGTAIAPVQLQATNSPTSFSADATLGNYGLQLSNGGLITGTPTQTAASVSLSFTASNGAGQSNPGTITLNLAAGSTPPPSGTKTTPTVTFASPTSSVRVGQPITLGAISSAGLPITYSLVSGNATISGNVLTPQSTAALIVRAATAATDTYNATSTDVNFGNPIPVGNSRLVNISSRLRVTAGDAGGASIAGFVITGNEGKQILIRGVGPSLSRFGIAAPLATPQLKLYDGKNAVIATNASWNDDAQVTAAGTAVGAFPLTAGSKDAALLMTLSPGSYTAQLQSLGTGTALIEIYDVAANSANPTKQLINISTRGTVGSGDDVLIGGFVVSGDQPKRVLIRGIGPGLSAFGVPGVLNDPAISIYDAKQALVAKNDNWGTPQPINAGQTVSSAAEIAAANTATGAFALSPGSADAAVLITLPPGAYSAVVTGANGASGAAMVEVYEMPE